MSDLGAIGVLIDVCGPATIAFDIAAAWNITNNPIMCIATGAEQVMTPKKESWMTVTGTITDSTGSVCARTVLFYRRDTGRLLGTTTSSATTGVYTFSTWFTGEINRVVRDDDDGVIYNNLIDRVLMS